MPFVQATRSLGRAGLFSLTVLRGSLPTRDFLAELTREIYKIGARSLPIIAVGGAFVGLVLTLQGYRTLTTFGAADALSTLLGLSLYRELAPVLTALLFIGRAGSSIAAELGLMRATDQIKALELMAIDPVAKAVAPRFWAAVLTVPLLTGIFCSHTRWRSVPATSRPCTCWAWTMACSGRRCATASISGTTSAWRC